MNAVRANMAELGWILFSVAWPAAGYSQPRYESDYDHTMIGQQYYESDYDYTTNYESDYDYTTIGVDGGVVYEAAPNCINLNTFVDEIGDDCCAWHGYNCSAAVSEYSYTDKGQADVLAQCPLTCSTCMDMVTFVDEQGYECCGWSGHDCGTAVSEWNYTNKGQADVYAQCPLTCGTCTPGGSCMDSVTFVDEQGYACCAWQMYNCSAAVSVWNYTENGQADLFAQCGLTCGTCNPDEGASYELTEPGVETSTLVSKALGNILDLTVRSTHGDRG